ncbi:hypothetical protein MKW92_046454 [Papaver armeniacum]|nr:hypothetical protein MKW92_046454 [Papaver armeniacum]
MGMLFSLVFGLLCPTLLLSQVASFQPPRPLGPPKGRREDKPRPPPPGLLRGPPSGRPSEPN